MNFHSFQELIARFLLISVFLQSCGGEFNNPLIATQQEQITFIQTHTQAIFPSANTQQVLAVQGGRVNIFYETDEKIQAEDEQEIGRVDREQRKLVKGKAKLMDEEEQGESDEGQEDESDLDRYLDRYRELYRLATIEKEDEAQFMLGLRAHNLWKKEGLQEQAYQEAINWLEKAANQNHQAAIVLLQELHHPIVIEKDAATVKQFIVPLEQEDCSVRSEQKGQEKEIQPNQALSELFRRGKKAYRAWRKLKKDTDCQAAIQYLQQAAEKGYEPASKLLKRLHARLAKYQKDENSSRLGLYTTYSQNGPSFEKSVVKHIGKEHLSGLSIKIWAHILSYIRDDKELTLTRQVNSVFDKLVDDILSKRLQKAIIMADEVQVKEILKAGVNPQIEDENGASPLYLAADQGHLAIVNLLLAQSEGISMNEMAESLIEDVNQRRLNNKYITYKDEEGNTPLHLSAKNGHLGFVNLILNYSRACMYTQNHNGQLPLHLAAQEGHKKIVRLLGSIYAVDNNGQTPLHLAVQSGHLKVAKELIKRGAQINIKDVNHNTPLKLAVLSKNFKLKRLLSEKSRTPNNRDKYGFYKG
jgi:ankyrin repeat protein